MQNIEVINRRELLVFGAAIAKVLREICLPSDRGTHARAAI